MCSLKDAGETGVAGGVTEWLKVAVLKTVVPQGTGGSNPSSSVLLTPLSVNDGGVFFVFRRAKIGFEMALFFPRYQVSNRL